MADKSTICKLAESTCRPDPEISLSDQHAIVVKYLLLWLNSNLKGDPESARKFDSTLGYDQSVEFERNN